jgi:hypothetical protein
MKKHNIVWGIVTALTGLIFVGTLMPVKRRG